MKMEQKIEVTTNEDKTEEKKVYVDENGNQVEIITKTEVKNGEETTEVEKKIIGVDGSETVTKTKTEVKNGETIISFEEKIVASDGSEKIVKTKTEVKSGEEESSFEEKIVGGDGSETITKTKTEVKSGEEETYLERKFIGSDGKEVIIKTKSEVEAGEEEFTNLIEVKGAQFETKLSVKAESKEAETTLKAELSTGVEQDILIFPDEALQIVLDEFQTVNDLVIEIKEVSDKAVFSATANQEGKLFGLFDTQVDLETLIDTETGEIIKTTKPWWAFLVVGVNEETICHIEGRNGATTVVLITEIKEHLSHGDAVGECPVVCGDELLVEPEVCELGDTQECTVEGYAGTGTCNNFCDGFTCVATESCGDGIVNGPEACDGSKDCDNLCQIVEPPVETNSTIV